MSNSVKPIPEGFYSITPYMIISNAAEAIESQPQPLEQLVGEPKKLLEIPGIGKRMAENVWTDALALGKINPTTNTLKQHVYPTTSQGKTALTQKHMIFVRIANRQQRIAVLAIPINVEKQSA